MRKADLIFDLDTNELIWCFMLETMPKISKKMCEANQNDTIIQNPNWLNFVLDDHLVQNRAIAQFTE